jgi:hypothetical protein
MFEVGHSIMSILDPPLRGLKQKNKKHAALGETRRSQAPSKSMQLRKCDSAF